ncbi:MAG: hypothetical protein KA369_01235 [Spirochaetes bacterium]|nr:hypothetical protein [Spirochaetota bacterium]
MNIKRYIIASVVVFVVLQAIDWLVHGVLLASWYQEIKGLWRPDMMNYMWLMMLGSLFFSFMFVFIFTKSYESRGVAEGARYGLLIGLLMNVTGMLGAYAMYPIPFGLAAIWLVYGIIELVIAGMITAVIYRK